MRNTKKLVSKSKKRFLAFGLAMAMAASSLSPMGALPVFAAEDARAASKNNADGQAVANSVLATLQAVEYGGLGSLVAPSNYSGTERLNKQKEILLREGYTSYDQITEEMLIYELNLDNLKVMSFENAYAKVQEDLDILIPLIVQNSEFWGNGDQNTYFTNTILNNKEKLLLGLTYIYRLYDFNIGDVNIKDKMFEDVDYFGKDYDQLQWLIKLGGAGGDALKIANNTNTFGSYFAYKMTNASSVTEFLEAEIAKNSGLTADTWFKESSKAEIIEQSSSLLTNAKVALYSRLKADGTYTKYILPLLNVSENSVYVISAPASITLGLVDTYAQPSNKTDAPDTYASEIATFKEDLAKVAASQSAFTDLWYRIAKEDDRSELIGNRMVLDTMRIKSPSNVASSEWSPKLGDDASIGVVEFFAPMGLYTAFVQANAQAEGTGMRFFMSKAISNDGLCTYTHELTHLLLNGVWMNDNTPRQGLDVEFFARGLYESYWAEDPIMNLNMAIDYSGNSTRVYNEGPERFQTVEDLQEYAKGMMDVIYTLDYLEAQAILGKTTAQKKKWFNQMTQTADTRTRLNQGNAAATHTVDTIVNIDDTLAASLTTVNDLVDNSIVASRYAIDGMKVTGTAASNGYHVVPLFASNYSVAQNDNGVAGDVATRRQAYEFLAEYGYFEGMVPYISNQYLADATAAGKVLSDTFVVNKIFNGDYADMKAFKKAMFAERAEKLDQLKPITITYKNNTRTINSVSDLQTLMTEAVEWDLEMVYVTNMGWNNVMYSFNTEVEKLKAAVYTAYLQSTNDFTTSIYTDEATPTTEPTVPPTTEPTETPAAPEKLPVIKAEAGDAHSGEGAGNATDDNTNSMWHTNWYPAENNTHDSHWIQVELDDVYAVSEFKYLPRQSGTNGIITSYKILLSVDGQTFTEVKAGDWAGDATEKTATFTPVNAKYVRLQTVAAMSDQDNADGGYKKFACAAEISVYGGEALNTPEPSAEPTTEPTTEPTAEPTEEPVYGDYPMAGSIPASDATVTTGQPFAAGTANSNIFRIPCLITLDNGNLLGAADIRYVEYRDFGGIDTIAAVSADDGATWKYSFPINFPDSDRSAGTSASAATYGIATTAIDPILVQGADGTIYCMADMNPSGITTQDKWPKVGTGYVTINGVERLALTSNYSNTDTQPTDNDTATYEYYVGDFDENGFAPVLKRSDNSASGYGVDEWFNLYGVVNGRYVKSLTQTQVDSSTVIQQNAFYKDSVLHVYNTGYIWLVTSNDGGMSWDNPRIINTQVKRDNEVALLVSPGRGLVTSEGDILVGCYNAFYPGGPESASAFYLKAGSTTWQRTSNDIMNVSQSSENEIVELYDGTLRMFYRSNTMKMCYADITKDANGNYVMGTGHELGISISSNCNISAIKLEQTTIGGKPVVLTSVPEGPGSWNRVKGRIYVFTINEDNTMNHISTYKFNESTFAYSCMTELEDGNIGILWEPGIDQAAAIRYSEVAIADIIPDTEKDVVLNVGEKYTETLLSDAALTVGGTPNASVAKVQITTTEGEKPALCDKNSTTANTALTMEGAGLTFTATDTENVWKITTEDGLFMVNRKATSGAVTFFQSEEGTMTVTPDGTGAFDFKDTVSGRYTMFFTTNVQFNAMGTNTAGANYKYGLALLEKQDTISADDTIPGYKQVNTITSGKTYLVTYVHNGTRYVLYPSTATSAWDSYTKTPTMVPAYVNELVITGMGAGTTAAVIGNMTYNIKVNTGGVVEVRLKVGETYQAEGLMTTRPSESIVGINEVSKGYTKLTAFDQLTDGAYLIGANSFIMKNEANNVSDDPNGLGVQTIDTNNLAGISYPQYLWNIKAVDGGYTIQDTNGKYLAITGTSSNSAPVTVGDDAHTFVLKDAGDGKFFIGSASAQYNSTAYYLNNFRGDNDNIAAYAAEDNGAKMYLYKAANPEITLTAEHVGETIMVIGGTTYKITVYDDATPTPPETVTPEPEAPEASALKEVVIDFGLPTVIHLDPLGGDTDGSVLVAGTANYGTVAVSGDITNGWDITYTPNKVLTDKDVVTLTTQDANTTYSVNVYPANSVFYEETFKETVKGTWEQKGDISVNQEAAAIGDTQNGAANYGYDVVYEGQEILTASATGNADSSLVQFNGSVEMLEDCLYTFTSAGTENEYYISSVNADGNQVYLNFQGGGKEGRRPHSKDQSVIVLVEKEATPGIIYFKDKVGSGSGSYLHFRNTSSAGLYFDRCSGNDCAEHKLKVYEWTDVVTAGAEIPGYKQVTSAADIKDGGRYLIVAEGTDANSKAQKYLLHPPVGNGNATADYHNASVAPSWMHVAQLSRQNQVRTEVVTTEINAEKSFAFKGTGVDVYANSSKDTGIAMVMIKNADNSDKIEKFVMVDTRLPKVGELAASPLASMIDTLAGMETAYNVPIVSISGLDLANYKVSVIHAKKDSATSLKLDGFRTYGTLADTSVYAADKENNVVYKDFKDSLLAAWSVSNPDGKLADALANNTYNQIYNSAGADLGAGVVLLDSANTINFTNEDVRTEYLNKTSKNEVYLYPGQSLTFKVAASNVNPQIGLRSLKEGVKYSVTVNGGAAANVEMNATTEMYYPLAMADADTTFVITNTGKDGILAVTKLKASNPTGVVMLSNVTEKDIAMALISMGIAEEEETPVPTVEPTETEAPAPSETEEPTPSETPEEAKDVTEIFSDVHTDWYTDYVQYVYDNGLMNGIKGTDRFEPNANITKAQVAQVLYNMEGQPMVTNLKVIYELSDIPEIEWYTRAVAWAYNRGIVTGDTNAKKFFPNADVTREQLALMMYRYAEWKEYDVSATSDFAGLENAENVSNWASEGMRWAVGSGLISGVEKDGVKDLDPQGNATRAQMAAILQRFCDTVK